MAAAHPKVSRMLWIGGMLAAVAVLLGAAVAIAEGAPFPLDRWLQDVLADARAPVAVAGSMLMNTLGGGIVASVIVPVVVAALLLWVRGGWTAVFFLVATALSAGVVQLVKQVVARPRPEDMIVVSDFGSFPSGHVANAATLAVAMMFLFPGIASALAGAAWVVLMAVSRILLGAHWLSDTIAGALIGGAVALGAAAAFSPLLAADARRRAERRR